MTVESPTGKASANWDVYGTPDKPVAKNVILLIADGLSMGHRTSARLMSKGVTNGMYNGKLSMDTLPYTAMLGTCSVDSIAADSANTASLHDRAQVQRERPRRLRGPYPDSLDDPKQGNHRRTAPPQPANPSAWFRTPKSRTRPGFRGRAYPRFRADKAENRGYVLQREARRHHRRRFRLLPASRTSPGSKPRTTRTTSKCSRRKAMPATSNTELSRP